MAAPNIEGTSNVDVVTGGQFGSTVGASPSEAAGFHGVSIVQGVAIAPATDAASAITQLNLVIAALVAKGMIA